MAFPKKRPAASTTGGVAKKPARSAKALPNQRCQVVSTALAGATTFPQHVRDVLHDALPGSLCVPKEQRLPFQEQVITMAGEVLKSLEVGIQSKIDAAEKTLGETTEARAELEAAAGAADAAAASKAQATEMARSTLAESSSAHKACKEGLASAQSEQKAGNADCEAVKRARAKKAKLESAKDLFARLKEGTVPLEQVKSTAGAFSKLGKELAFEASLLAPLQNSLVKAPATRTSFDARVLEQAEGEIESCSAAIAETLASGELAISERAAKVDAASVQLEEAVAAERSCKVALAVATSEQKKAEADQKAAAKAVRQFGPKMKEVAAGFKASKASLKNFREGPLKAFAELLAHTNMAPPVEAKAAAEAAPAEDKAPTKGTEAGPAAEPEVQP